MTRRIAVLAGLFVGLSTLSAHAGYHTTYTFKTNFGPGSPLLKIMLLERGPTWSSDTWAFSAPGDGTTTITNPFNISPDVNGALHIGIVQDLPFDAPGQKHMVLLLDDTAADLSNHIAWGTLFRNTLEEDLIAALELATSGQDFPIIQPGLDFIGNWAFGDAETGILGPGGIPHTAWFTPGGTFTVMAWSDGAVYGTGSSQVIFVPSGDLDGDGDVDGNDYDIFNQIFGLHVDEKGYNPEADMNGDGVIDCLDVPLFMQAWHPRFRPIFDACRLMEVPQNSAAASTGRNALTSALGIRQALWNTTDKTMGPSVQYRGPTTGSTDSHPTATGDTGACGVGMTPVLGAGLAFGAFLPLRRSRRRQRGA